MSLLTRIVGRGPNGFGADSTAEQVTQGLDLSGKTYLLTGAGSGLGLETLRVLALRNAHVIASARSTEKASAALQDAHAAGTAVACELSEPSSVLNCVEEIRKTGRRLDGIICCAGIMALPKLEQKLGYELQFFTNHVGHFLLVTRLLDLLAEDGRVVMLSSEAHKHAPRSGIDFDNLSGESGYGPWLNYGQSKLANLLFAKQLAKRLAGSKRTANAVHPGVIRTNLKRHMGKGAALGMRLVEPIFFKNVQQGAATQCYVAAHPSAGTQSGLYFADCNPAKPSRLAEDAALAERLWTTTEEIALRVTRT